MNIPVHTMPAPVVAVLPVIKKLKRVKDAEVQCKRKRTGRASRLCVGCNQEVDIGYRSVRTSYSSMIRKRLSSAKREAKHGK